MSKSQKDIIAAAQQHGWAVSANSGWNGPSVDGDK